MSLRVFHPSDSEAVAAVFRDAVLGLGAEAYTAEQTQAWARAADDPRALGRLLMRGLTLVAEEAGAIAAFGQLEPADRLAFLYCAPSFARRGHASALYAVLETEAMERGAPLLETNASRIARPFFEKHGFVAMSTDTVMRHGVALERFRMNKVLAVQAVSRM